MKPSEPMRRPHGLPFAIATGLLAVLIAAACGPGTRGGQGAAISTPGVEVQVGKIRRGTVRAYVHTYGTVEAAPAAGDRPAANAAVASQIEGVVAEASCFEGQPVSAGTPLFLLDPRATDAAIAQAEVELRYARKTLERRQSLIEFEGTSESLLQESQRAVAAAEAQLAKARTDRALLQIRAPLSGTVVKVWARPGEAVRRDSVLAEIIDLDRLVISLQVPADQISAVRVAQAAAVFTERHGAEPIPALVSAVSFVGATVDRRTGSVPVRVILPPASGLAPGSLVDVQITTDERRDRLVVPVESIVRLDGRTTIARVDGTTASQVPVTVELIDGDLAEISGAGLREGMTIVTVGAYGLPDGATIRVQQGPATQ
jgi:membrane fusion protein (multidrug efflux system)